MTPPESYRAQFVAARVVWRDAVNKEHRVAEQYAMRRIDEALDGWLEHQRQHPGT